MHPVASATVIGSLDMYPMILDLSYVIAPINFHYTPAIDEM